MDSSVSGVSAWSKSLSSFTSWPLFTYPPFLLAFLICTLIPLVLFIDNIASAEPEPQSRRASMAVRTSKKHDATTGEFKGNLRVNNTPPTKADLEKVAELKVLDAEKKSHTFKSLYADDENGPRRLLIIFIRHFFCGICQEYLRSFSSIITPDHLSELSTPTEVIIIGCGQPDLIPLYVKETGCPYTIYADPTRKLYDLLGMTKTMSLGNKHPDYMQRSMISSSISSFLLGLRSGRHMLSAGDFWQVGGEFIFEEGKVTWCHRMRNTRDHAETLEVQKQFGLDSEKGPIRKRWSTGLTEGLGRRLSNKRQSWSGLTSRGRNEKGSPPREVLDQLKEEGGEDKGTASGVDAAFDKLTGGASKKNTAAASGSTGANGVTNGQVAA